MTVQSQSPLVEAPTPTKTRADSPTPLFEAVLNTKHKPFGHLSPKAPSHQHSSIHPFSSNHPSTSHQFPASSLNKCPLLPVIPCVVVQEEVKLPPLLHQRRRSISLEGKKLESIVEDQHKKPHQPAPSSSSSSSSATRQLSSSLASHMLRKMSLSALDGQ